MQVLFIVCLKQNNIKQYKANRKVLQKTASKKIEEYPADPLASAYFDKNMWETPGS